MHPVKKKIKPLCCSSLILKQTNFRDIHSLYIRIYFIISRLKFATFNEYFTCKNKAEAEILKRIDIILCIKTSVNTIQFYDYTQLSLT